MKVSTIFRTRHENLFQEEENDRFFLQQYKKHLLDVVDTYAYCLMPNHFHFMLRIKDVDELRKNPTFEKLDSIESIEAKVSKSFANLFISYTMSFYLKHERKGSLFMKRFKRKPIEFLEQWQEIFLYIHLNPINHKFSNQIEDWKWSSWHAYHNMESKSLLTRPEALSYFDNLENLLYCTDEKRHKIIDMNLE